MSRKRRLHAKRPDGAGAVPAAHLGRWLAVAVVAAAVLAAFSGSFGDRFVDWDDSLYVADNPLVTQPAGHWAEVLGAQVALNYHPLTIASMMLNASLSGAGSPRPFIVTDVLIHLANSLLAFWFAWLLSGRRLFTSFFVALFFAVHPTRVESVAWVSERKDVLYAFFFIASCIAYLKYLDSRRGARYLALSGLLFLASCLSKAQAVVLPLVLLLLDYWRGRRIDSRAILEKVPFLALSLLFGGIALSIQSGGDFHGLIRTVGPPRSALSLAAFPLGAKLQYAGYGFMMYVYHLVVPLGLCPWYQYETTGPVVKWYAVGPWFALGVVALAAVSARRTKFFAFGVAFFAITVALVLQFITVGAAVMADRYTYVPYLGLLFILGTLLERVAGKARLPRLALWAGVVLLAGVCVVLTRQQVAVWRDTGTLFAQVIEHHPNDPRAYYTRGKYLGEQVGDLDGAIALNRKAIDLGYRDGAGPWEALGTAYGMKGDPRRAITYLSEAIRRGPTGGETYTNRGIAYLSTNDPARAVADFEAALRMKNGKVRETRALLERARSARKALGGS